MTHDSSESDGHVYKRDASWYNRPRARSSDSDTLGDFVGKYHFANLEDPAMSACGRSPLAEFTGEDPARVPKHMRCGRRGCAGRWVP